MPVYEYECKACHKDFEYQQRMSDPDRTVCEACGGELERLISRTAFTLKGSGWYKDLYSSAKPADAKAKDGASDGASAGGEKKAEATKSDGAAASGTASGSSGTGGTGGSGSSGGSSGSGSSGGSGTSGSSGGSSSTGASAS
jgi:putative FmdB family regulatory protein